MSRYQEILVDTMSCLCMDIIKLIDLYAAHTIYRIDLQKTWLLNLCAWLPTTTIKWIETGYPSPRLYSPSAVKLEDDDTIFVTDSYMFAARLDLRTNKWTRTGEMFKPKRLGHSTVVAQNLVWVLGGIGEAEWASVETYNPRNGIWERKCEQMLHGRYDFAAVAHGNYIYVFGGVADSTSCECYDLIRSTIWDRLPDLPFPRNECCAVIVSSDHIAIIGGKSGEFCSSFNDTSVMLFHTNQRTWSIADWTLPISHSLTTHDNALSVHMITTTAQLVVVSGESPNQTWITDIDTRNKLSPPRISKWIPVASLPHSVTYRTGYC